jgi:hypothetical protein
MSMLTSSSIGPIVVLPFAAVADAASSRVIRLSLRSSGTLTKARAVDNARNSLGISTRPRVRRREKRPIRSHKMKICTIVRFALKE